MRRNMTAAGIVSLVCALAAAPTFAVEQGTPTVSTVVAEVNGVVITYGELLEEIDVSIRELKKTYSGEDLARRTNVLLLTTLNRKKNDILLLTEAEGLLTDRAAAEVQQRVSKHIRELTAKYGSLKALKENLSQQGETIEDEKQKFRKQALINAVLHEHVYSKITVSPEEMLRYYDENRDEFKRGRVTRIVHILIPARTPESRDSARAAAGECHRRIREGADVTEVARKHSKGPHANKGGIWETVKPGTLRPEVDFYVFALAEGELSPIIETDMGYHIVKVLESRDPRVLTFEEAQEEIYKKIYEDKFFERRQVYLDELEKRAFVRMLWEPEV